MSSGRAANRRPRQTSEATADAAPSSPRTNNDGSHHFRLHSPIGETRDDAASAANSTMKGTVKKWLSRGAAAVAQANSTTTKRDSIMRRDPLSSMQPRDHRESINLHDIDAIMDMGEDTEAMDVVPAVLAPRATGNVAAIREVWTAFETEAKSKIYSPECTDRRAGHADKHDGAAEVHEQRTIRHMEPMQPHLVRTSGDANMCSSPVGLSSRDVPKPWMANEDVQWSERDAEGLRRNSASDIQPRSAADPEGAHGNGGAANLHVPQGEEHLDHYPVIHNGYESDDTVVRPPLVHSRSIHRPVQGGLYTTISPTLSAHAKEQMARVETSTTSTSTRMWDEIGAHAGPRSPLAMVMASIVLPDLVPSADDGAVPSKPPSDGCSPSTSNDSLGSQYAPSSPRSPVPKSKKDLRDLQSLQMLAMRPTTAAPLTPAKGGSWAMMVSRDIFERASDMERRRQEAIYELIATEETYVADLEIVDELFFRPMQKLLSRNDVEAVFGNLKAVRMATERLMHALPSFTPAKHADHQAIRQAVDLAEDLLRRSNEAARDRADLSRLKEIAASLIMDSEEQQLDLTGSTRHLGQRRFVMEGVWMKGRQGRRITAFLFTDLLLLCEPARAQAGMYKPYLAPIPLLELEVRETSGTRSLLRLEDSAFQIVHKKRSLTVKTENAGAKRKWMQAIKECTGRCHEAEPPSLRELTRKVLWAIRVMIVEVAGLTTSATSTLRFERSTPSVYCSVSLNQRQTYRTAVAFLFTITDLDDPLRVALYSYGRGGCS
ncbi:hypothetical protein SYNPS1DRAFT_21728 [Syncephalis pseudoplumigaleata]|uniref:DH domain-containing protein n=1 Tax=Syncephalis pseudoplumigaleata TaxID=1712513 RepID=A0A4P9Z1Z2_9FUNG|nr:hypothetical protein SYNPS1DRAFT_21728 [Syncephalis pseudoplumigaleata]|eukprot:RKP26527.1 hypothetical protein SYNPS1DRAFT_21728 [Syncephalis pseudoplumigaleata]